MPSEFALIDRHFRRATDHTALGIGDDGALIRPHPGMELVVSTDMLVAGTHFLADTDPEALGWKTLAVNVSDMAAMGAQPRWALLAAALPAATESWIDRFARGLFACAGRFAIDLIGGDTTRGPRNFCVTIIGEVPVGRALLRSGAKPGDEIWLSGVPGRAALGLAHIQGRLVLEPPLLDQCLHALHRPQPRLELGLALRGLASAAIDVSDGVLADLGHILDASAVCAELRPVDLPPPGPARHCWFAGGDDYELVFTAPKAASGKIEALSVELQLALTRIGVVRSGEPGAITVFDPAGHIIDIEQRGYDHFS